MRGFQVKLFIRFGVFAIAASSTANEYTFLLLLLPRHSHSSNSIARTPCPPERRCHDPEDSRELERAVTHAAQLHLGGSEAYVTGPVTPRWYRGGGGGGGGGNFIQSWILGAFIHIGVFLCSQGPRLLGPLQGLQGLTLTGLLPAQES